MPILIIMRHGKAEKDSATGRDGDRILRDRGRSQARFVGQRLAGTGWAPALILYSSLARADETASIVAEATGAPRERCLPLEFGQERAATSSLAALLGARLATTSPLMVVGHNMQLEVLCGVLAKGVSGGGSVRLRTGEACIFEVKDGGDVIGSATLVEMIREPSGDGDDE